MTCLCHPVSQPPEFSNFLDVAKVFLVGTCGQQGGNIGGVLIAGCVYPSHAFPCRLLCVSSSLVLIAFHTQR